MNTKQLRQKILDLAIRGKLVPQDPNDEPASVLLERIRAEKEKLIKEGKIKRDKNISTISRSDDKSHYGQFEIPSNWAWTELGRIANISTGPFGTMLHKSDYVPDGVPIVNPQNIFSDGSILPNKYISEQTARELCSYLLKVDDVVIGRRGEMGRCAVVSQSEDGWLCGTGCFFLRTQDIISSFFLTTFMRSDSARSYLSSNSIGATMDNLNHSILKSLMIPLPPLAEQHRIVTAIESAFAVIDEIEAAKSDLQTAVATAKQKILSLAIRGKLVPQDPNDEPASALLERIGAEREQLIKAGKIKRSKAAKAAPASVDNSYYAGLPKSWAVCRLDEVLDYEQPTTYIVDSTDYRDEYDTPVLTAGKSFVIGYTNEIHGVCDDLPVIIFDDFTTDSRYVDFAFKVKSSAMKILRSRGVDIKYLYHFMQTVHCDHTTHKRYWISDYSQKVLALPPLAEQHRIVTAIEAAFEQLDSIAATIA